MKTIVWTKLGPNVRSSHHGTRESDRASTTPRGRAEHGRATVLAGKSVGHLRCILMLITPLGLSPLLMAGMPAGEPGHTAAYRDAGRSGRLATAYTGGRSLAGIKEEAANSAPDTVGQAPSRRIRHEVLVAFGRDLVLKPESEAQVVVSILGNVRTEGTVHDNLVAVGGDVTVAGPVHGDIVAVMGSVQLSPGARVTGDVVSVGGTVAVAHEAELLGRTREIRLGDWGLSQLVMWVRECVFKLRPLSLAVPWVWVGYGTIVLFYLVVLLIFPRAVEACAVAVEARPTSSLLAGLLTKILVPMLGLVLALTGVGLLLVPILLLVLVVAGLIGKVGLTVYLGRRLIGAPGAGRGMLLGSFAVGLLLVTGLYLVPVVGLLTLAVVSVWGLGAAVLASWAGLRQEVAPTPAAGGAQGPSPARTTGPASIAPSSGVMLPTLTAPGEPALGEAARSGSANTEAPPTGSAQGLAVESAQGESPPGRPPRVPGPPVVAGFLPRAGFWERMGAACVDLVVVVLLTAVVGWLPLVVGGIALGWLMALLYFALLWTWKGTTVGGVIFKLRVLRLDGQPLRFEVSVVRALGAMVSVLALFLGFLWITWDPDRQAWHDKLVGTVVVRLPQSPPLLCI